MARDVAGSTAWPAEYVRSSGQACGPTLTAASGGGREVDFPPTAWDSLHRVNAESDRDSACLGNGEASMTKTVALAGLGAIGLPLARALDRGMEGLKLIAVSARDLVKARARLAGFNEPPQLVDFDDLARADIVVEAT